MGDPARMDVDPIVVNLSQPTLFEIEEPTPGIIELFPAVWNAAEALTYADPAARRAALRQLQEMGAARFSPLVVYLLTSRITDPDLEVRAGVVNLLADVLLPGAPGQPALEIVRQHLGTYLSQMRTRQIYALLQLAESDPSSEPLIACLLNACPHAGNHLGDLLAGRGVPLAIRRQAATFIGRVGYVDMLPAMERIQARLEARLNGQQAMPFVAPEKNDETELLPAVQAALELLRAP